MIETNRVPRIQVGRIATREQPQTCKTQVLSIVSVQTSSIAQPRKVARDDAAEAIEFQGGTVIAFNSGNKAHILFSVPPSALSRQRRETKPIRLHDLD